MKKTTKITLDDATIDISTFEKNTKEYTSIIFDEGTNDEYSINLELDELEYFIKELTRVTEDIKANNLLHFLK